MPDLIDLRPIIPTRALEILEAHGASLDELAEYSTAELESIKGIGPKWAKDIYESLALLRDTTPPEDELTELAPDFESLDFVDAGVDAIAAMPADTPVVLLNTESALELALGYLDEVGRHADTMVLRGKVADSGAAVVLETAIAILEGLRPGNLGPNLAQDVREAAGLTNG